MLDITVGEFINIESENDVGVLKRYLVQDITKDGHIKLVYQSESQAYPDRWALEDYMKKHSISKQTLADILDMSRTTLYRYLSGKRKIPAYVFVKLGIGPIKSAMQQERDVESARAELVAIHGRLQEIIKTL